MKRHIHLVHFEPQTIIVCVYVIKCYAMEKGGLKDNFHYGPITKRPCAHAKQNTSYMYMYMFLSKEVFLAGDIISTKITCLN